MDIRDIFSKLSILCLLTSMSVFSAFLSSSLMRWNTTFIKKRRNILYWLTSYEFLSNQLFFSLSYHGSWKLHIGLAGVLMTTTPPPGATCISRGIWNWSWTRCCCQKPSSNLSLAIASITAKMWFTIPRSFLVHVWSLSQCLPQSLFS